MELCVCTGCVRSLACVLVAKYCNSISAAHKLQNYVTISSLGPAAIKHFSISKQDLPVLFKGTEKIEDSITIIRTLATSSDICRALLVGKTPLEQGMIEQQIQFIWKEIDNGNEYHASFMNSFNEFLKATTFLASHTLTLPDLVAFPYIQKWIVRASKKEISSLSNITRWFDHLQHLHGIENAIDELPIVDLQIDTSSKCPIAANNTRGSEKGEKRENIDENVEKKKKKEKEATTEKAKIIDGDRAVNDVTRLNVLVGQIKEIWKHPDAEKLYCEKVDVGEKQPRIICSGLVDYVKAEDLINKKVCVLANMKPKKLRGVESHGMLMCATSADKTRCEILQPPPDTPIGERVVWEGLMGEADNVMNTKTGKYPFEQVQPDFHTDDNCVAFYKDHKFITSKGVVRCACIKKGTIS